MSEKLDLSANDNHYDVEIEKLRRGELAFFGSEASKLSRYETFVKWADFKGKRVLDIGAGPGIFYDWLKKNDQTPAQYVGTDIHAPSMDFAREQYVDGCDAQWYTGDLLDSSQDWVKILEDGEPFDIVMACGLFAIKTGTIKETRDLYERYLEKMLALTKKTDGICMITNLSVYKGQYHADEFVLYPDEVLRHAYTLTERVALDNTYAKHDFLLVMQSGDNLYHQVEQREQ